MVWVVFRGTAKLPLVFKEQDLDGPRFWKLFKDHLLPMAEDLPVSWMFVHNGAPSHKSKIVKNWLKKLSTRVTEWPAYSSDLNHIKNIWEIMVRNIYANGRQFFNVENMRKAIEKVWNCIDGQMLLTWNSLLQRQSIQLPQTKGSELRSKQRARVLRFIRH